MKEIPFTGIATAIVTPMKERGVDYDALAFLIERQIESGISAIVVNGTTGESATLTDKESESVIKFSVKTAAKRIKIIAGTGSNDTRHAEKLTEYACKSDVDGVLLVTPYYNKATQKGLIESYAKIADASDKPCILYNVPSRTGCNILPETVKELSYHPKIVGIKEASGNISQVAEIISLCKEDFAVYSGNDDMILPVLSLGGKGAVSVLSNILPTETRKICDAFFSGDISAAAKTQTELIPIIKGLFSEVNPIPVKAVLAKKGFIENRLRLPLTEMDEEKREKLFSLLTERGFFTGERI